MGVGREKHMVWENTLGQRFSLCQTVNYWRQRGLFCYEASPRGETLQEHEEDRLGGFADNRFQRTFPQKLINQLGALEPSGAVPEGRNKVGAARHVQLSYIVKLQDSATPLNCVLLNDFFFIFMYFHFRFCFTSKMLWKRRHLERKKKNHHRFKRVILPTPINTWSR